MPTESYTQERGGEIDSNVPIVCAAVGVAIAAFVVGGFIEIITLGFGAVVGGCIGMAAIAIGRVARGRSLGPSGDVGMGTGTPDAETPETAQHGEAGMATPSSSR